MASEIERYKRRQEYLSNRSFKKVWQDRWRSFKRLCFISQIILVIGIVGFISTYVYIIMDFLK